jgi:GNAT superfamily N-acetyltransferase
MRVEVESRIERTARVRQLEGLFDVPPHERAALGFEIPDELVRVAAGDGDAASPEWRIGLIVGPSGSGKTTVANALWGNQVISGFDWPPERAVVDGISAPIKETTRALTAVGFGSPPAWLRPFRVLSSGEQFRATVARALVERRDLVVVDEFTSVVDRQVAKVASAAVARAVRRSEGRLVAITCHYDVLDWLQPDWTYRPDIAEFEWRSLQPRPRLEMEVRGVGRAAWAVFGPHHYLSGELAGHAKCVGGFIEDECVAFCAYFRFPHPHAKDIMLNHRTVVLPDYQGLGIGERLTSFVGQMLHSEGWRFRTTLAHPALRFAYQHSPRWKQITERNKPARRGRRWAGPHADPRRYATSTFEYVAMA